MLYEFKNSLMKQLLCLISGNKKKKKLFLVQVIIFNLIWLRPGHECMLITWLSKHSILVDRLFKSS